MLLHQLHNYEEFHVQIVCQIVRGVEELCTYVLLISRDQEGIMGISYVTIMSETSGSWAYGGYVTIGISDLQIHKTKDKEMIEKDIRNWLKIT